MKRITSLLLTFCMILTAIPVNLAAEELPVTEVLLPEENSADSNLPDLDPELLESAIFDEGADKETLFQEELPDIVVPEYITPDDTLTEELPAEDVPEEETLQEELAEVVFDAPSSDGSLELFDANTPIDNGVFGADGDNLRWVLTAGGTLTISGSGATDDWRSSGAVPWSRYRDRITALVVTEGVTTLDYYTCWNLYELQTVELPASAEFDYDLFSNLEALVDIILSEGHEEYCTVDGILCSADGTTLYRCPQGKTGTVEIPEGVEEITNSAFANCQWITAVTLPQSLKYIYSDAFRSCTSLEDLEIPKNVSSISSSAFASSGVTEITVAQDNGSFSSIDGMLCNKSGTTLLCCPPGRTGTVVVPEGIKILGNYAFRSGKLESLELPASLNYLMDDMFYGCYSLKAISVADGNQMFADMDGLLVSKDGTTLYSCPPARETLVLPEGITTLEEGAFQSCSELTELTLPNSMTSFTNVFYNSCNNLKAILVAENHPAFTTKNGILYSKDGTKLLCCPGGQSNPIIAPGTQIIAEDAFRQHWFSALAIPSSVIIIEKNAFMNGGPDTLYYAGTEGQWNEILIYKGNDNLLNAEIIFEHQDSTFTWNFDEEAGILTFSGTGVVDYFGQSDTPWSAHRSQTNLIVFEEGITGIGQYAFWNFYQTTSVSIPASLSSVAGYAFAESYNISMVIYAGTEDQWDEIDFGKYNEYLTDALLVYADENLLQGNYNGSNWTLDRSTGTLTISGGNSSVSGSYWDGLRSQVKILILEDGITQVSGFNSWPVLETIVFPDSLNYIDAFYDCDSLTSVTLPAALSSFYTNSFQDCDKLTEVLIEAGNRYFLSVGGVLYNTAKTQLFKYPAGKSGSYTVPSTVTTISGYAFHGCDGLTEINLPGSVTKINSYAFYGCTSLTDVVIPEGITSIASSAFRNCTSLTEVNIPKSVTAINSNAFYGCTSLTDVVIPESVTAISSYAFYGCTSLTEVVIPEGVTSINNSAFRNCSSLTEITIPEGVTFIGSYAFAKSGLTEVTVPTSVTEMRNDVFYGCHALTHATILAQINLLDWTFGGCESLTEVTLPATLTQIGEYTFDGCANLKTVYYNGSQTLWDNISIASSGNQPLKQAQIICGGTGDILRGMLNENVSWELDPATGRLVVSGTGSTWYDGESPWRNLVNLTSVVFEEGITNIVDDLFCGAYLEDVYLPASVIEVSENAFYDCVHLKSITVDKDNARYYDDDGVLILRSNTENFPVREVPVHITASNSDLLLYVAEAVPVQPEESLICYPAAKEGDSYTVPDSVTSIVYHSFADCSALKTLYLPNTLTELSHNAFLSSLSLEEIVMEDGNAQYFTEDGLLYSRVSETTKVLLAYPAGKTARSFTIPEDVVVAYFPNKGSLTDLTVHNGVQFVQTGRRTNKVIYEGSREMWDVIHAGNYRSLSCKGKSTVLTGSIGKDITWSYDVETYTLTVSGTGAIPDYPPCPMPGYDSWCVAPWSYLPEYVVEHIVVKEGITSIGDYAFCAFDQLESLKLPSTVEHLGTFAFNLPTSFKVQIPAGVTSMNGLSFGNTRQITLSGRNTAYSLEDGVLLTADGKTLVANFNQNVYDSFVVPEGVTTIGAYAFYNCRYYDYELPDSLTAIESYAFYGAWNFGDLTLPENVSSVGSYAFFKASLYDLSIDNPAFTPEEYWYITGIGYTNLDYIRFTGTQQQWESFGGEVQEVYPGVRVYCEGTGDSGDDSEPWWYFDSSTGTIHLEGTGDLDDTRWTNLSDKAKAIHIGKGIEYFDYYSLRDLYTTWPLLTSVTVEAGNLRYFDVDGVLFKRDGTADMIYYPEGRTDTTYTVPDITYGIDYRAFFRNAHLQNLIIPGTVAYISENFNNYTALQSITVTGSSSYSSKDGVLFEGSELLCYPQAKSGNSYTVPKTVTQIAYAAFAGSSSLQSVTLPAKLESIGSYAFADCTALESITIPEGITRLLNNTFTNCDSLESVALPGSLMCIYEDAFLPADQTHVIDTATFNGSAPLLQGMTILYGNEALTANLRAIGTKNQFSGTTDDGQRWTLDPATGELVISGTGDFWDGGLFRNTRAKTMIFKEGITGVSLSLQSTEITSIVPPASVHSLCNENWTPDTLERISVADGNPRYWDDDGVLMEVLTEEVGPLATGQADYRFNSASIFASSAELVLYEVAEETVTYNQLLCYPAGRQNASYTLPEAVTSISNYAFDQELQYLQTLVLHENVEFDPASYAWSDLAYYATNLQNIELTGNHPELYVEDGVLFRKLNDTQSELLCYPSGRTDTYYKVPDGVIAAYFSYDACRTLDTISVPQNMMDLECWTNYVNISYRGAQNTFTGTFGDGLTWTYDSRTLTISGNGAMPDYSVDDYVPWGCLGDRVTELCVAEGITHVGDLAFLSLFEVESVTLPSSLKSIGAAAFYHYDLEASLRIPAGVTEICGSSLMGFAEVTLDKGNRAFDKVGDFLLSADGTKLIAYLSKSNAACNVPIGVTTIGKYAFFAAKVTDIDLPDTVTTVEAYAFHSCKNLTSLELPTSVNTVGIGAIFGCVKLEDLTIGNPAMRPDRYWFVTQLNYTSLETITFKGGSGLWADASANLSAYYPNVTVKYGKTPDLYAVWDGKETSLVVYGDMYDLVSVVVAFYDQTDRLICAMPATAKQLAKGVSFWPTGYTADTCSAQVFLLGDGYNPIADMLLP